MESRLLGVGVAVPAVEAAQFLLVAGDPNPNPNPNPNPDPDPNPNPNPNPKASRGS